MKHIKILLASLVGVGVLFTVLLAIAINLLRGSLGGRVGGLPQTPDLFSQGDIVSLWFGLLGVMVALAALIVTGIGIGIAVLSIFGYGEFKSAIQRAELRIANSSADIALRTADRVASSNDATKEIRDRIKPLPPDDPVKPKRGKRLARSYHDDVAPKEDVDVT